MKSIVNVNRDRGPGETSSVFSGLTDHPICGWLIGKFSVLIKYFGQGIGREDGIGIDWQDLLIRF